MADVDLNEADEGIVDLLREGRNTPSNIARHLDYSREYVSQRLKRLTEHGIVVRVDRGLYGLEDDPADSDGAEDGERPPPESENEPSLPPEPSRPPVHDEATVPDVSEEVREKLRERLSGSGDLLERRVDEMLKMYAALRELGEAEKSDLLAVVDVEATDYQDENSVWANMAKGVLGTLPGVESPPSGKSTWRHTGG